MWAESPDLVFQNLYWVLLQTELPCRHFRTQLQCFIFHQRTKQTRRWTHWRLDCRSGISEPLLKCTRIWIAVSVFLFLMLILLQLLIFTMYSNNSSVFYCRPQTKWNFLAFIFSLIAKEPTLKELCIEIPLKFDPTQTNEKFLQCFGKWSHTTKNTYFEQLFSFFSVKEIDKINQARSWGKRHSI